MVAIQRWSSSNAQEAVVSADGYTNWWASYERSLKEWDRLVEFVDEGNSVDVDLAAGQ